MKRRHFLNTLEELHQDLVEPIKDFSEEVYGDTIGDAKRFYAAQAKKAQEKARLAEKRMKGKAAAARREQEEMKKHRKAMMKRATILFAVIIVAALIAVSVVLHVRAA